MPRGHDMSSAECLEHQAAGRPDLEVAAEAQGAKRCDALPCPQRRELCKNMHFSIISMGAVFSSSS